jgi:hypothetical protein
MSPKTTFSGSRLQTSDENAAAASFWVRLWRWLPGGLGVLLVPLLLDAAELPAPEQLIRQLEVTPAVIEVIEPHLESVDPEAHVEYIGVPVAVVLDQWLGPDWREDGYLVEFRALDGYVSRVMSERLRGFSAWLTFARADGAPFQVDNIGQRERDIPLGPYYLVWDNLSAPELLQDGATHWPYQVHQIALTRSDDSALLPEGLTEDFRQEVAWARKYCLTCHRINGHGGDKMPINLAQVAKNLAPRDFMTWLLNPEAMHADTTMPGLPVGLLEAEREEIAEGLYRYLFAMPLR